MRTARLERKTKETNISVRINLDGTGKADNKTGIAFLDHMLDSLATHSLVDISVKAKGDLQHHIVEDVAITLGKAIGKALGERSGIRRFGDAIAVERVAEARPQAEAGQVEPAGLVAGRAAIWLAPAELRARFYQGLDLLRQERQTSPASGPSSK